MDCPWGTYHLQSDPGVHWFDFAQEIFQQANDLGLIDKSMRLIAIPSSEFPTPVKRPSNSKLAGDKIAQAFAIAPADWQKDLTTMLTSLTDKS
jgi:dTDP-4-dehydrorhamnose reductase